MSAPITVEQSTVEAPTSTEQALRPDGRKRRPMAQASLANLKRYPKGQKAPGFTHGRVGPNRKSLEALIRQTLQERNGERLRALALSIVQDAIKGDAAEKNAARALLLPRIWPILDQQLSSQRTVQLGVRLELSPGTETPTLSIVAQDTTQPLLGKVSDGGEEVSGETGS